MNKKYKIAVIGSHTALQILKGARDEGFETICITPPGRTKMYESFGLADKIIKIKNWSEFDEIDEILKKENAILIPHGSMVEYLGMEGIKKLKCLHYGTKEILEWEGCREKQREWLEKAGIKMPKKFDSYKKIKSPCIIKFNGAKGGHGYFIAKSPGEFMQKLEHHKELHGENDGYTIQEYVVGAAVYAHFFYSKLTGQLEIMGFDKRYESNADSIGRIAAKDQIDADIDASYTIVGNIPMVLRESLLPEIWEMGMNVVKESQKFTKKGLHGPFCLECIVDQNLKFKVFEISARIVAGTNPFINGTPYTWLKYDEPMSSGRRIAREIKEVIEQGKENEIFD